MPALVSLPDQPLLYLIGVNHAMQFKGTTAQMCGESESVRTKREAFQTHIAEMFDKLAFEILAEEWSDEAMHKPAERETALDEQSAQALFEAELAQCNYETVLQQFRKAKGVEHRFCDPTSREKQALGIEIDPQKETDSDREKRRRFWLSKIADCKQRRVLFVCGDNHYDPFAELLESNGFNVRRGAHYPVSDEEFLAHVPWAARRPHPMLVRKRRVIRTQKRRRR